MSQTHDACPTLHTRLQCAAGDGFPIPGDEVKKSRTLPEQCMHSTSFPFLDVVLLQSPGAYFDNVSVGIDTLTIPTDTALTG